MKHKKRHGERPSSRGKAALSLLAVAIVLVSGALMATTSSSAASVIPARPSGMDLLTQAKLAYVDGELAQAEELIRGFLSASPEDRAGEVFLARVLSERSRLDEAKALYAALLKSDPKDFQATVGMARALKGLGQPDFAMVYFRRASQLRAEDPGIWKEMGLLQRERGELLEALSSFQQSLTLDPKQADITHLMSEMATGKESLATGPSGISRMSSFDPLNPKPIDPASLIPRPQVPDPMQWAQKTGGRIR